MYLIIKKNKNTDQHSDDWEKNDLTQLHSIKVTQPEEIYHETVTGNRMSAILAIRKISQLNKCFAANFTFTDSIQSLPLDFVFISQGHGVTHCTAQDGTGQQGTAGYLSPPQLQILTRLRNLVHSQHYSPGHTATAHTPARKEKINKNTHVYVCVQTY